jgi:large subunit ribosomal protein L21
MSAYAIIRTGGKQYRVSEGQVLLVERLAAAQGEHVFDDVLLVSDGNGGVKVGAPSVDGASVRATVLGEQKAKKVLVFKKKRRKGYRRKRGHRQVHARVRIDSISA